MKYIQLDSQFNIIGIGSIPQKYTDYNIEVEDNFDIINKSWNGSNWVDDIEAIKRKCHNTINKWYDDYKSGLDNTVSSELGEPIEAGKDALIIACMIYIAYQNGRTVPAEYKTKNGMKALTENKIEKLFLDELYIDYLTKFQYKETAKAEINACSNKNEVELVCIKYSDIFPEYV